MPGGIAAARQSVTAIASLALSRDLKIPPITITPYRKPRSEAVTAC